MRIVGRYFTTGATLGSISGLVALVLIWSWMTLHLGLFGFLIGWIPAGIIAAAVWITMVVFWAPILVIGTLVTVVVLALSGRRHRDHDWEAPPAASPPEPAPAPIEQAPPPVETSPADEAPASSPPPLAEPPATAQPPASSASAVAAPPTPPPPPAIRVPKGHQSDDLNSDAAAAGDTSHKRPQ